MSVFGVNNTELDMEELSHSIQALPGGGLLVVGKTSGKYHVLKLDNTGSVLQTLTIIPDYIYGFIMMESNVLLIHQKSITRVRMRDGEVMNRYKVRGLQGWLMSGLALDQNNILLVDKGGYDESDGRVFTYRLSDGHTEDKVIKLKIPQTVTRIKTGKYSLFFVNESGSNRVNLYNSRWGLQTSITETPDGPLDGPSCIIELPSEPASILIADNYNHRISQFTTEGRFIKHLIQRKDNIEEPNRLSYCHSYLYVTCGLLGLNCGVKCFKLFR